mmetsp:Transcript_5544/g.8377  ORF Transcript_5544/g.8377 Transcript_5544/m.8377 type:complete len:245 (-) Transcript_5544:2427-3161(-)
MVHNIFSRPADFPDTSDALVILSSNFSTTSWTFSSFHGSSALTNGVRVPVRTFVPLHTLQRTFKLGTREITLIPFLWSHHQVGQPRFGVRHHSCNHTQQSVCKSLGFGRQLLPFFCGKGHQITIEKLGLGLSALQKKSNLDANGQELGNDKILGFFFCLVTEMLAQAISVLDHTAQKLLGALTKHSLVRNLIENCREEEGCDVGVVNNLVERLVVVRVLERFHNQSSVIMELFESIGRQPRSDR